jgi:putative membrane protein
MRIIARYLVAIAVNGAGLLLAAYLIPGFGLEGGFAELAWIAFVLTILNFLVKPVLKLVLGPIIILTLGLGLILVNMLVIYLLDILSDQLTIVGIPALFYAAVLLGIVNFVYHLATKKQ